MDLISSYCSCARPTQPGPTRLCGPCVAALAGSRFLFYSFFCRGGGGGVWVGEGKTLIFEKGYVADPFCF